MATTRSRSTRPSATSASETYCQALATASAEHDALALPAAVWKRAFGAGVAVLGFADVEDHAGEGGAQLLGELPVVTFDSEDGGTQLRDGAESEGVNGEGHGTGTATEPEPERAPGAAARVSTGPPSCAARSTST
jgi:hypothetical protein